MSVPTLSLIHKIRKPRNVSTTPAPLLILLHGWARNEQEFFNWVSEFDERFFIVSVRGPLTLNVGSYSWFTLDFTPTGSTFNIEEVRQSQLLIWQLIDQLLKTYDLDAKQVYLMGFSQGAIMNHVIALTQSETNQLAGVVAASGQVPFVIRSEINPDVIRDLPIFMVHGTEDAIISINSARANRDFLETLPVNLTYREYGMGHELNQGSLTEINAWLRERLEQQGIHE